MSYGSHRDASEPHVLIVDGSPRVRGNSDQLARRIAEEIEGLSASTEIVWLRDLDYSSCVGCELCRDGGGCARFEDGMTPLYDKVREAQGLALISPVHNYNVTAWMKAFIDRLYCFYEFDYPRPGPWRSLLADQGRKAIVVAVAEQPEADDAGFALEAMRRPLEALGYEVVDEVLVSGVFEKGSVSRSSEALRRAEAAGRMLADRLCDGR